MITIDPPSSAATDDISVMRPALTRFLRRAREVVGLRGSVDLLLTDDRTMRRLNREFRGKNKSTDVLSFPAGAMPGLPEAQEHAGDLAISLPIAGQQAAEQGHGLGVELRVLVLHGLLHLHGMDHETDEGEMATREGELRRRLRLPEGLIGRAAAASSKAEVTATKRSGRVRA